VAGGGAEAQGGRIDNVIEDRVKGPKADWEGEVVTLPSEGEALRPWPSVIADITTHYSRHVSVPAVVHLDGR
jgi:hypothetical protein